VPPDFEQLSEHEPLDLAEPQGVTLVERDDGRGWSLLGIGGGIRFGDRAYAVSYLRDWMRRAGMQP
jgi:hypothetical protein